MVAYELPKTNKFNSMHEFGSDVIGRVALYAIKICIILIKNSIESFECIWIEMQLIHVQLKCVSVECIWIEMQLIHVQLKCVSVQLCFNSEYQINFCKIFLNCMSVEFYEKSILPRDFQPIVNSKHEPIIVRGMF